MYTEDDRKNKFKFKKNNTRSNVNKNYNNSYEEDYYKDYYDDYKIVEDDKKIKKKTNVNKLDTSYSDDYSDGTNYNYDKDSLKKKKYGVIIIILVIVLISLIIILLKSLNVSKTPVENSSNYVRLQENQIELKEGDSKKLDLILSDTSSNYKIEWFSNDDSVAIVDDNGKVTAINEGEAIILVAYYLNNKVYDAECHINVLK